MAIRLGIDLKLFDAIANRSSEQQEGSEFTIDQIAEDVKADPRLVGMGQRLSIEILANLN